MPGSFSYKRSERISELLHREISIIIRNDVRDPRVSEVTVTAVDAAEDLRNATIYFVTHEEDQQSILAGLQKASGFIRSQLGKRCYLKYLPTLAFRLDRSQQSAARIDRIIAEIHQQDRHDSPESDDPAAESDV